MTNKFFYNFTPKNNGGESVTLTIDEDHLNQTLSIESYGNSTRLLFTDNIFTNPELLRDLANKVEEYNKDFIFD